jgi:hypothetical protein
MGNCPEVQSSWLDMCIGKKTPLLPSAKTIAVKAQILKWLNDAPNDKIISKSPKLLQICRQLLTAGKSSASFASWLGSLV